MPEAGVDIIMAQSLNLRNSESDEKMNLKTISCNPVQYVPILKWVPAFQKDPERVGFFAAWMSPRFSKKIFSHGHK